MFEVINKVRQRKDSLFDFTLAIAAIIAVSLIFGYLTGYIFVTLLYAGIPIMPSVVIALSMFLIPILLSRKLVWTELKALYLKVSDKD